MDSSKGSRLGQFRLIHVAYLITLLACGFATFGASGILLATPICVFWGLVFSSRSRPRALIKNCVWILFAIGLFSLIPLAMGYSPRSAVHRMICANNLKRIVVALHNYHDTYGSFPPAYIADSNGRPMHSWRVLLLPFLEEENLYKRYSFDEPWDGPNNRQLLNLMPQVYACPSADRRRQPLERHQPNSNTCYLAVVGPMTAWPGALPRSFSEIDDGTSNTALVIEQHRSSVPWFEPRDLTYDDALATLAPAEMEYDGDHRPKGFLYEYAGGRHVAFADGIVRYVSNGVGRRDWAALLGVEDGLPLNEEDLSVSDTVHRRLQTANCIRLALFLILALFPMPWVWLNPSSNFSRSPDVAHETSYESCSVAQKKKSVFGWGSVRR